MTLLFGVIEWGYAFHDRLTVGNMSVAGARSASGEADDVLADHRILQVIGKNSASMPASKITTIVIYRATGPDDKVPDACKTASVTNTATTRGCNRYTGADLALGSDAFGCVGPPGPLQKIDRYWCPTTRKTALLAGTNGPPDYVGVYVRGEHQNFTGFFGGSYTFTSDTVIRIEPRSLR